MSRAADLQRCAVAAWALLAIVVAGGATLGPVVPLNLGMAAAFGVFARGAARFCRTRLAALAALVLGGALLAAALFRIPAEGWPVFG